MSGNRHWTNREIEALVRVHATGESYKANMHFWPGRTHQAVLNKAVCMKLGQRPIPVKHSYSACWETLLRELEKGSGTGYGLAERTRMCNEWPGRLLRKNLASEEPKVHIAHWVRSRPGGCWVEVWALGEGPNAVKPRPMTNAEIKAQRNFMAKLKSRSANPFAVAMNQVLEAV